MIRLTDEEIKVLPAIMTNQITHRPEDVAKAQLKKVVEWGDEMCEDRSHNRVDCATWYGDYKRNCTDCWQSLLEEVKEG